MPGPATRAAGSHCSQRAGALGGGERCGWVGAEEGKSKRVVGGPQREGMARQQAAVQACNPAVPRDSAPCSSPRPAHGGTMPRSASPPCKLPCCNSTATEPQSRPRT